jgi:chemotaxis protein methyltransferase CheR
VQADGDLELELLLEAMYRKYHYDFRSYSRASLRRRVASAVERLGCASISGLQERLIHDPKVLGEVLRELTVPVSELFRDPSYFRSIREKVIPILRTYPSVRIWIAGCATGEEVYSFAILLEEEGLLDRAILYATDIDATSLRAAEAGVYAIDRLPAFTRNYQRAGGTRSLSDYYTAGYGSAVFDRRLRRPVVFSDHSLATDEVFAEVQMVSCRNVLIYFDRTLQDRAIGLFADALCTRGFLGLGAKEALRISKHAGRFEELVREDRIYRLR